ncbi:hypothetical protein AVEN_52985-1 [Araneus ventricosus]|uniref:Uncharacterized protein n=1 Tax=Araneus ventricosus TaxID=182803 RepID=A0A4Y2QMP9_ARAVE|nr:hypothetical protein AVEN_52985-1 [Araneus ventricosus]
MDNACQSCKAWSRSFTSVPLLANGMVALQTIHLNRSFTGSSRLSIFQPFHLGRSFMGSSGNVNPSVTGHSDPLLHLLLPLPSKRQPLPAPISSKERETLPLPKTDRYYN